MTEDMQDRSSPMGEPMDRRVESLEMLVFLFLILPSMVLSLFVMRQGKMSFVLIGAATILRDLSLVALILYFLWRNGEPLRHIGWAQGRGLREVAIGLGLFVPFFYGAGLLGRALEAAGLSGTTGSIPDFLKPEGGWETALAVCMILVVAVAEETIFRGYLVRRLGRVSGSTVVALLLSSAIFSLGHGYEGSAGVITVGFMGLAFGAIYLWRRSLIAPIVMHFLQNFVGMILVPMIS